MAYNHSNDSFYDSARWKAKREAILRRDHYLCQECRKYGKMRAAKEVHHIKHLEDHPELALDNDNLVSLCHRCHNKMHPEKAVVSNMARERYRYD